MSSNTVDPADVRLRRPSKYRNEPTVVNGIRFASRREAKRYTELVLLEKAGAIRNLVCHPCFELSVNGHLCGTYVADFSYVRQPEEEYVVEDVKSKPTMTAVYRIKKALVGALYGIEIREVMT